MQYVIGAAVMLIGVTTIAIFIGLGLVWYDRAANARLMRLAAKAAVPTVTVRCVRPESLEGVLAHQVIAGEITPGQYLHALEGIAARDEIRHPLAVPPSAGPSGV